jgi:1-acyl-sn-glycerol-3-phosphate acyltransferase
MQRLFLLLRSLVFSFWMYGLLILMGLICLPLLAGPRNWVQAVVKLWIRLVLWGLKIFCGVVLRIEGKEFLPKGGALIACKHQAMVDVLWPWLVCPSPALIFKKELSLLPIFGWYVMKLGNVMVDRGGHATALRSMVRRARDLAEQGRQIIIFPEGTRGAPGQKLPYKPGVAALYLQMDVPCVPVALNSGLHWPAHGLIRTPGEITIRILPPIAPGLKRKAFMQELQTRIDEESKALLLDEVR